MVKDKKELFLRESMKFETGDHDRKIRFRFSKVVVKQVFQVIISF